MPNIIDGYGVRCPLYVVRCHIDHQCMTLCVFEIANDSTVCLRSPTLWYHVFEIAHRKPSCVRDHPMIWHLMGKDYQPCGNVLEITDLWRHVFEIVNNITSRSNLLCPHKSLLWASFVVPKSHFCSSIC